MYEQLLYWFHDLVRPLHFSVEENSCFRTTQALKTYTILQQYEKENPAISRRPTSRGATTATTNNINGINENGTALTTNGIGGAATCSTTTPSPGSSTPSSFNSQTTV
ncbi:unnamed protein product [Meloidogyne enterolobii]|uniref:Uncharacterized protein n=1 Tax=Meloidogyne enterolobii TaxID=390850 RepID=A0ACB1A612_MELEN